MRDHKHRRPPRPRQALQGSLHFLLFGLVILAFLIAIDRPQWFNIEPASGTATAMAQATSGGEGAK